MSNNFVEDYAHLNEAYEAFGFGYSLTDGHLTSQKFKDPELQAYATLAYENIKKVEEKYQELCEEFE